MGNAHGLETVLLAAEKLQFLAPEIRFLLAGEGAERQQLANRIKANQLTNITLLPGQPREKIPALVSSTDVCLVPLKKSEVFKTVIPTKMLEFMSCGRPIILGVEGQAQGIVERAHAGLCIEPENPDALVAAILKLKMQPELARRLGINGRHYIVQNMSRQQTARDYESVLARVLGRSAQAATSN
jgi:glycosyltransferase involved in cell wall biosynthesis